MELIDEMTLCSTMEDCHEIATRDAYDEYEYACGWLACIEEMFGKYKYAKVFGIEVTLEGFDLKGLHVMAKCRNRRKLAFVSIESLEFPKLNKNEKLWLDALKDWNRNS